MLHILRHQSTKAHVFCFSLPLYSHLSVNAIPCQLLNYYYYALTFSTSCQAWFVCLNGEQPHTLTQYTLMGGCNQQRYWFQINKWMFSTAVKSTWLIYSLPSIVCFRFVSDNHSTPIQLLIITWGNEMSQLSFVVTIVLGTKLIKHIQTTPGQ